jgi:hypothetical protein
MTEKSKPMHHGTAMVLGGAVTGGALAGGTALAMKKSLALHGNHPVKADVVHFLRSIKEAGITPGKALGALGALGAVAGAGAALHQNTKVRVLRAAHQNAEKK